MYMKPSYLAVLLLVVALSGAALYTHNNRDGAVRIVDDMGTYPYACNDGMAFSITPAPDMSSIELRFATDSDSNLLARSEAQAGEGARFTGASLVLTGTGESVKLYYHGEAEFNCEPVPNQEMAPFNWGDPAEGAGVEQDASAALRSNLIGSWQSVDDPLFVRTFNHDETVVDSYDDKDEPSGGWSAFVGQPINCEASDMCGDYAAGVGYVVIRYNANRAEDLKFSIQKVTPEELQMTYIARGNMLRFTRVQ